MVIHAVTFDVYSALFDIHTGLVRALETLFHRRGSGGDASGIARLWRQKQREYLVVANSLDREPALNLRAIEAGATYALRSLRLRLADDELRALVAAWETLPPWPEVPGVLREVRGRTRVMATLSNGDEAMQRRLLAALAVPFDHIISTEGGKFKPHPSAYRRALDVLGIRAADLLHVAGSATDAMGATAFGLRTVWVNRGGDALLDARFAPAQEVTDLRGILDLITP